MNDKIISLIGALRQEKRLNVISNNLSNSQTIGFKKDIPVFKSLLHSSFKRIDRLSLDTTVMSFEQGDLRKTGNDLDFAIEGEGLFKLKTPSGIRYTRGGNFRLDRARVLVNSDGYPVLGKNGPIRIEGEKITVESDGSIKVDNNLIDKIDIVTFNNLNALRKEGEHLLNNGGQKEEAVENPKILQGFLEGSNVNPVKEMIELIETFRTFESCMKVIQSQDEMDSKAVNELGRMR